MWKTSGISPPMRCCTIFLFLFSQLIKWNCHTALKVHASLEYTVYCKWNSGSGKKSDLFNVTLWDRCSLIKHGVSVNVCARETGINSAWMHCLCVFGPPGLSELLCECCITGSRWELKDPGGCQRHFLLYQPAYWLPWRHCFTSPLSHTGYTCPK